MRAAALRRLAGLAPTVLHLAPPQSGDGDTDPPLIARADARRTSARVRAARGAQHRAWFAQPSAAASGRRAQSRKNVFIVPDGFRAATARDARRLRFVYASTTGFMAIAAAR